MQYKITIPKNIKGNIKLPASKSFSNRALIINALSGSEIAPENLSDCDDTRVMIKALTLENETIDIMAAGTAMRFLTAYLSVTPGTRILTGTERMRQRPIGILVDALRELGADIQYVEKEGFPPLKITGKEIVKTEIRLSGNVSSQYISALLMIAPVLKNGLNIFLTGEIISLPYINLTLQLMKDFGAVAVWNSENSLSVKPTGYQRIPFKIESDWSAASYWYQLAALAEEAEIHLSGLFPVSYQGDSRGAVLFEKLGVRTIFTDEGVTLTKSGKIVERLNEDFIDIPDLAQTFVVTCVLMDIPFRFSGLQTLKIKESDRIHALITELNKLGYIIREEKNAVLKWDGETTTAQAEPEIQTYEDHRMAMSFAPAGMSFPNIRISDPNVVTKSYPGFWKDLKSIGTVIEEL